MNILCVIVDFCSTEEAVRLSLQLDQCRKKMAQDGRRELLHIVHVDNGNPQPIIATAEQKASGVEVLRFDRNDGYSGGIRFAIDSVASKKTNIKFGAYWFLNSDLEIDIECLPKLLDVFEAQSKVGAVGPTVLWGDTERVWGARGVVCSRTGMTSMTSWPQGGVLPKWSYIPGSSLLIRREAYDAVGGLPSIYRMYYEETEMCIKLQKAGWDLWVEPRAKAIHHVHSQKGGIPARHFAFYFIRNNLLFWKRNFNRPRLVQLPSLLWIFFREIVLPLRRAKNFTGVNEVLTIAFAGMKDGWGFSKNVEGSQGQITTPNEGRWFHR